MSVARPVKGLKDRNPKDRITIPCGKCVACLENRRKEWEIRLKKEIEVSTSALFVTLTYQDSYIPRTEEGLMTLDKRDVQLFMKKLRKTCKSKLKYYLAGEYGDIYERPHYHMILFNLEPPYDYNLQSAWQEIGEEIGYVDIRKVTPGRIRYTTGYIANKKPSALNRQTEFALMSLGLGKNYVEKAKKWHKHNSIFYVNDYDYSFNLPRYFRNKIFTEEEIALQKLKSIRPLGEKRDKEIKRLKKLTNNPTEYEIAQIKQYEKRKIEKNKKLRL